MSAPKTLYEKIWDAHTVRPETDEAPAILYIDRHLVHEVSSPQAFTQLRERGIPVAHPEKTIGVIDHSTPTLPPGLDGLRAFANKRARDQVELFLENCRANGIGHHDWESDQRGIVHVMVPELGESRPGRTIVCGDSHTSTHGAFGCLSFGIGTTEVAHVLATQCLFQRKSKTMAVDTTGVLAEGVNAKDLALYFISKVGTDGGVRHVIEYRGTAIEALSMEGRMTLCNMSIEAGARSGMVAGDQTTLDWLRACSKPPSDAELAELARRLPELRSDDEAVFDKRVTIDARDVPPMVTFGTDPSAGMGVDGIVPLPETSDDRKALDYMQIEGGKPLLGKPIGTIFIGSCTNSRITDLREAAALMKGRKVANGVRALIVPGSHEVRRQAEAEGLDQIFIEAGVDWRIEPGCSMCIGMNGDVASPDGLTLSTSNRNFKGRQGPGAKTVLCGPAVAAASAIEGRVADPRKMEIRS
ncbi:3-isopropylmalate dehydratase large subunit [Ponticaulis profundi]|uniref:3-isopropylmalate dehydratase n=1 Tax=Ponticaulis profundi TaxID=2665222 RepID=A0ABW1SAT6_9PROT